MVLPGGAHPGAHPCHHSRLVTLVLWTRGKRQNWLPALHARGSCWRLLCNGSRKHVRLGTSL